MGAAPFPFSNCRVTDTGIFLKIGKNHKNPPENSTFFLTCGYYHEFFGEKSSILDIYKSGFLRYNSKAPRSRSSFVRARRITRCAECQSYDTNARDELFPPCILL